MSQLIKNNRVWAVFQYGEVIDYLLIEPIGLIRSSPMIPTIQIMDQLQPRNARLFLDQATAFKFTI